MRVMRRRPGHRCAPAPQHMPAASERGLRLDRFRVPCEAVAQRGDVSRFAALARASFHLSAALGHSQVGSSHHRSTHRIAGWFVQALARSRRPAHGYGAEGPSRFRAREVQARLSDLQASEDEMPRLEPSGTRQPVELLPIGPTRSSRQRALTDRVATTAPRTHCLAPTVPTHRRRADAQTSDRGCRREADPTRDVVCAPLHGIRGAPVPDARNHRRRVEPGARRGRVADVLADIRRGIWRPPDPPRQVDVESDPTFHKFASEWFNAHRGEWAPNTVLDYKWQLRNHCCRSSPGIGCRR